MKIVYCIIDASRAGGMERSICSKANYLADVVGYDVSILTTDKQNKENFYEFSPKIKFYNLDINYSKLKSLSITKRLAAQVEKRRLHYRRLSDTLLDLKPDVSISTYTHELSMLCKVKDGSKKVAEFHFSKNYREIEYSGRSKFSLEKIFALVAEKRKHWYLQKYDAFVVLTKEDKKAWGDLSNIEIIPNVTSFYPKATSTNEIKRVISVGRLTADKGYSLLIEAWSKITPHYPDWTLAVYGEGEDLSLLKTLINKKNLQESVFIYPPTNDIEYEYLNSSIYVMSSLYEGFGLVLTEAMACGLPCVSFACPSGPAEIITNGEDGIIVEHKNIDKLAEALMFLMKDTTLRKEMGENAKENVGRFLPERIMPRWISLFERITGRSNY